MRNRVVVLVDSREPEWVYEMFHSMGYRVEREYLDIGDIVIGDLCIERKTPTDLVNSVTSGRLWEQMYSLTQYDRRLLLIHDPFLPFISSRGKRVFYDAVATVITSYRTPVFRVEDRRELMVFLDSLVKKLNKKRESLKPVLHRKKKEMTVQEIREEILTCLPTVGRKRARLILSQIDFPTLISSPRERIQELKGVGEKLAEVIVEVFQR